MSSAKKSKVSQPFFVSVNWIFTVKFCGYRSLFVSDAFEFQRRYQGEKRIRSANAG